MRRLLPVLAALALLTGCSTVPTSSAPVQITEASARPVGEVGIEPAEPPAGGTPEEVVRGFIDAAASTVRNHPVARQYLTREAEDAWADTSGITLVGPD